MIIGRSLARSCDDKCTRRSSGAAIAFDCHQHHVDGLHVAFGCRCCQGEVAVAASMARASTDGLGFAARAAPCLPRALVVPLALRSRSVATVADEAVFMARALMGCICVVAQVAPHSPSPLCLSFPWWRRDHVCLPLWGSGRGGVDVFLTSR